MTRWGSGVLERLPLAGDETVLDAADAAPSMLVEARKRMERFGARVTFVECDLGRPLPIGGPVDAVFSTATFHWVPDHDALFANLAAVLRPGGRLVAQCGGAGNIASVQRAVADVGAPGTGRGRSPHRRRPPPAWPPPASSTLRPGCTTSPPGSSRAKPLETFLATVILRAHLDRLAEADRAGFVRRVAGRLPTSEVDYVRLNIVARNGGQPG